MDMKSLSAYQPIRRDGKGPLSHVSVLVADGDAKISHLIREVLKSLGFGTIYGARDGYEALSILKREAVDVVVTDWDMKPMNGLDFIRYMRLDDDSPNRVIPIIMLTGRGQLEDVETARDAGITEFLVKPFTAKALCNRLTLVVEHPRNFIIAPSFVGPDRRRKSDDGMDEKRGQAKGKEKIIAREGNVTVVKVEDIDEDIAIIDPDFSLKKKIGDDLSMADIFSPENIKAAQSVIFEARYDYLDWVRDDLRILEDSYSKTGSPTHKEAEVVRMADAALRVKSQAGLFEYDLASNVGDLLYRLVKRSKHLSPARRKAVRKHLDVLYVVFQKNVKGAGGQMGEELLLSLSMLAAKTTKQEMQGE